MPEMTPVEPFEYTGSSDVSDLGSEDAAAAYQAGNDAAVEAASETGSEISEVATIGDEAASSCFPPAGVVISALLLAYETVTIVLASLPSRSLNMVVTNLSGAHIYTVEWWKKHGYQTTYPANDTIPAGHGETYGFQNTDWHTSGCAGVLALRSNSFPNGQAWIGFRIPEVDAANESAIAVTQNPGNYSSYSDFYDSFIHQHQRSVSSDVQGSTLTASLSQQGQSGYAMAVAYNYVPPGDAAHARAR